MFKGSLIESERYYRLRRRQLFLGTPLFIGIFVNFNIFPVWFQVVTAILFCLFLYVSVRNRKDMENVSQKSLEIEDHEIRIKAPDGRVVDRISLAEVDVIQVKENYGMYQEDMKDVVKEMAGEDQRQRIVVVKDNKPRNIDFEIPSYYMLNRLQKIIDRWRNGSLTVELV